MYTFQLGIDHTTRNMIQPLSPKVDKGRPTLDVWQGTVWHEKLQALMHEMLNIYIWQQWTAYNEMWVKCHGEKCQSEWSWLVVHWQGEVKREEIVMDNTYKTGHHGQIYTNERCLIKLKRRIEDTTIYLMTT